MKRYILFFAVCLLLVIGLNACYLPTGPTPQPREQFAPQLPEVLNNPSLVPNTNTVTPSFQPGMVAIDCDQLTAENFGYIQEIHPSGFDTNQSPLYPIEPTFTWYFTPYHQQIVGDWGLECVPDSFSLFLASGPYFNNWAVLPVNNPTITFFPDNIQYHVNSAVTLEEVTDYRWMVVGHYNSINIGDFPRDKFAWPPYTIEGPGLEFLSGRYCGGNWPNEFVSPPILTIPMWNDQIYLPDYRFSWRVDTCRPSYFKIHFSTTQSMINPITYENIQPLYFDLSANTQNYYMFQNCTQYFWQVVPWSFGRWEEDDWGNPYYVNGPFYDDTISSSINSFFVNNGSCNTPMPLPPPVLPTDTPTAMPVICTSLNQEQCNLYPQGCDWVKNFTTSAGGYCKEK